MANIWWPLDSVRVTGEWANSPGFYSQFGQRGHNGIDLAASVGTPVYATDAGTIQAEGWGQHNNWMGSIAGIYVLIRHSWGYSGYAHLSRTIVDAGQKISKGQLIGYSGATGVGTGPHLHFETFPLYPNFGNGFAGRVNPRTHNISARGSNPAPAPKPQTVTQEDDMTIYIRRNSQAKVYAYSPVSGKKRAVGTTEWNTIKRAYAAGKLALPITNLNATEAKHFGI